MYVQYWLNWVTEKIHFDSALYDPRICLSDLDLDESVSAFINLIALKSTRLSYLVPWFKVNLIKFNLLVGLKNPFKIIQYQRSLTPYL